MNFLKPTKFPGVSGNTTRREATNQFARVRKHTSHPTRRGNRKGQGRRKGTNERGQV
jgi:hypothetical protein